MAVRDACDLEQAEQATVSYRAGGRVEVPLPLQFGDDLAAAGYGFFADRERGLRSRRHHRLGGTRRASAARLDGRRRIAFAAWQRNVRDTIVARAHILRLQERWCRCTSLRRHVRAWARATVGARALYDAERARAALAEQEAAHARMVQQVATKQAAREAAERRSVYQRGMLRGSEAADAAWERKLEATREQDAHAAFLRLQNMEHAHALSLSVAVREARAEAQAAVAVAAKVAVSGAAASVEGLLQRDVEKTSAVQLSSASRAERGRRTAFYSWLLVVDEGRIGRVHAARLSLKLLRRRILRLGHTLWCQFLEHARRRHAAAALADSFKLRQCRSKARRCLIEMVAHARRMVELSRRARRRILRLGLTLWCQFLEHVRRRHAAAALADSFKLRQCQSKARRCLIEMVAHARRMVELSRRTRELEILRYRRRLQSVHLHWHRRATLSIRVLEMSLRSRQRLASRMVGCVFNQWLDLTLRSLLRFAQGWRHQRLLTAFTKWSVTVDDTVSARIGARLLDVSDRYCRIAGIPVAPMEVYVDSLVPTPMRIGHHLTKQHLVHQHHHAGSRPRRKDQEEGRCQDQDDEHLRWVVQSKSHSESLGSDCDLSARSLAGVRRSLADITKLVNDDNGQRGLMAMP